MKPIVFLILAVFCAMVCGVMWNALEAGYESAFGFPASVMAALRIFFLALGGFGAVVFGIGAICETATAIRDW